MARRVAITGAAGQLGRQLVRAFTDAGDDVLGLSRPEFDITDASHLARLTAWRPHVVVNSAAWTDVDGCARDPEAAMRINGEAAGAVARAAADAGALIVQVSTNEVFDGTLDRPYQEDDATGPLNPYGASKLRGEELVAAITDRHLIIRTAWLFGPGGTNFITKIRAAAERATAAGQPLRVVADEIGNPTPTPALADAIRAACDRHVRGVLHLAGVPSISRYGWAQAIVSPPGADLEPIPLASHARPSRVPQRAALAMDRSASLGLPTISWLAMTQLLAADGHGNSPTTT